MASNFRNGNGEALGLIETKGLIATIAATDSMCKAANVTLAGHVEQAVLEAGAAEVGDEDLHESNPANPQAGVVLTCPGTCS